MFENAYDAWLQIHSNARSGERLRRLKDGHRHAEKEMLRHIWWPAFRQFNHLHPEYEVTDSSILLTSVLPYALLSR